VHIAGASESLSRCSVSSDPDENGIDGLHVAHASRVSVRRQREKPRLDSGADRNFFWSRGAFHSFECWEDNPRQIEVATGVTAPALGRGTIVLRGTTGKTLRIPGCWFAPTFVVNLVSTDQLGELGITTVHEPGGVCKVMRGQETILTGHRSTLDAEIVMPDTLVPAANSAATMDTWHLRFVHAAPRTIEKVAKNGLVDGMDVKGPLTFDHAGDIGCVGCELGKSHRLPFPTSDNSKVKPGQVIVVDLIGPVTPADYHGNRYGLTIRDIGSRCGFAYIIKAKSDAAQRIIQWIDIWQARHPDRRFRVLALRSDQGKEFMSKEFERDLADRGMIHQYTARYTAQQNGIAERSHRTDTEGSIASVATARLAELKLPAKLWNFVYLSSVYVHNMLPGAGSDDQTAFERFTGRKPDVSHLRAWGCEAFVHIPSDIRRGRFHDKAYEGVFVGYGQLEGSKAWFVYVPSIGKVVLSRDVTFREAPLVKASRRSRYDDESAPTPDDEPQRPTPREPVDFGIVPERQAVAEPTPDADCPPTPEPPAPEPDVAFEPAVDSQADAELPAAVEPTPAPADAEPAMRGQDAAPPASPPVSPPPVEPLVAADDDIRFESPPPTPNLELPLPTLGPLRQRPVTPKRSGTPPSTESSPDPLLVLPGRNEFVQDGSYYRPAAATKPSMQPSSRPRTQPLAQPRWKNPTGARLANAVPSIVNVSGSNVKLSSESEPPVVCTVPMGTGDVLSRYTTALRRPSHAELLSSKSPPAPTTSVSATTVRPARSTPAQSTLFGSRLGVKNSIQSERHVVCMATASIDVPNYTTGVRAPSATEFETSLPDGHDEPDAVETEYAGDGKVARALSASVDAAAYAADATDPSGDATGPRWRHVLYERCNGERRVVTVDKGEYKGERRVVTVDQGVLRR